MRTGLLDFATGIYEDLGSPTDITVSYISGWLYNHIGDLNIAIDQTYSGLNETISPFPSGDEQAIYQNMFNIKYYNRASLSSIGAAGTSSWTEIEDDGSRVKRVSKLDLSKSYLAMAKSANEDLATQIAAYQMNRARPQQSVGDDANYPDAPIYPSLPPRITDPNSPLERYDRF